MSSMAQAPRGYRVHLANYLLNVIVDLPSFIEAKTGVVVVSDIELLALDRRLGN